MIGRFVTLMALVACMIAPARAEDLSRYCGHPVDSRNIVRIGKPLDPSTCSANCFRFVLTCNNGRKFTLASRYNPTDPDWLHSLTSAWPLPQAIVFALVGFLTFVMSKGHARKPGLNYTYLGIVGITGWFWPAASTSNPYSFSATMVMVGSTFVIIGFPVFIVLNLPALMRGWNYMFVKHPAEPIVAPALQSGTAIDTRALARTLGAGARASETHPAYHYENQAEKARALRDKLDSARAEVSAAERALEEAKRRAEHRS